MSGNNIASSGSPSLWSRVFGSKNSVGVDSTGSSKSTDHKHSVLDKPDKSIYKSSPPKTKALHMLAESAAHQAEHGVDTSKNTSNHMMAQMARVMEIQMAVQTEQAELKVIAGFSEANAKEIKKLGDKVAQNAG